MAIRLATYGHMFEWLEQEIASINTPHFHVIKGPDDTQFGQGVIQSNILLPSAYKEFVLKFGNVKLYRNARNNSYRIGVFAKPKMATLQDGATIHQIGFHDGASVYIKPTSTSNDFPIFEFEEDSEEQAADGFEEWLTTSYTQARARYTRQALTAILNGPKPFTSEEKSILEARRKIKWRVLGIDAERNQIFEVKNESSRTLPFLTIGVRSKDKRLNGAVRLNIGQIVPGQTTVLAANCYKDLVSPVEIETFPLPDPQPEDREYYYELLLTNPT
jgi:hypothetical protein